MDVIKLKGNFLQSIEYSPFSRANKLTILDISNNKIQTIDRRAFSQLREIETLNLSNNQINYTDETEPDWSAMTNLKEFILNNNNISTNHIPFSQASPYEMLVIVLNSADFRQDKHNCFVEFWVIHNQLFRYCQTFILYWKTLFCNALQKHVKMKDLGYI